MHERILVPLDGSSAAQIVLPYAWEIAAKLGSELFLVSVSESRAVDIDHLYLSYLELIKKEVQSQLKAYGAKKASKLYTDILLGAPADEILRYADESNVNLIIMGSRGSSGRGPWLLGNIAAKVLRATKQPVMLIRREARLEMVEQKKLLEKIIVPLDGSKVGEAAIPCVEALAKGLDAELVLYHVVEPGRMWAAGGPDAVYDIAEEVKQRKISALTYLNSVGNLLKERGVNVSYEADSGSAADQIIDYTNTNAIGLIAMSTHGRSGIGRWVFGSVTDKVLHAGDTPVLVVPAAKA